MSRGISALDMKAVGLHLAPFKDVQSLFSHLTDALGPAKAMPGVIQVIALPEFASLVFLEEGDSSPEGIRRAAEQMEEVVILLAGHYGAFVSAAFPVIRDEGLLMQEATLAGPYGLLSRTKKHNLSDEEIKLDFVSGKSNKPGTTEIDEFGRVGTAICWDAFFRDYLEDLDNPRLLFMPSANPQVWDAPARRSGVWQPQEWADAQEQVVEVTEAIALNPMLRGEREGKVFAGQSSIVRSGTAQECPFVGMGAKQYKVEWLACETFPVDPGTTVIQATIQL